jgi:LysR family transcriptional regulator, transcriptional activator of the cysJI operon
MDIGLFKTFIAVVKNKSISKASETIYLTQPAVTKQIQLLEQLYDNKLFDRSHKKEIRLTDEGRQLLDYANRIIGLFNESLISIGEKEGSAKGSLHIATNLTLGIYVLPRFIKFFRDSYPQIQIEMTLENTEQVIRTLKKKDVHFGFIGITPEDPSILSYPFFQDRLQVVMGSKGGFSKNVVRWKDLYDIPFIGREVGSDIRTTYEGWLQERTIDLTPQIELNNTEAIKSFLAYGLGFSILPRCSIEHDVRHNFLRVLSVPHFSPIQTYNICLLKEKKFSVPEKVFLEFIFSGLEPGHTSINLDLPGIRQDSVT